MSITFKAESLNLWQWSELGLLTTLTAVAKSLKKRHAPSRHHKMSEFCLTCKLRQTGSSAATSDLPLNKTLGDEDE